MATKLKDAHVASSVVESTQTTGTGTLDLDGAQIGFLAFVDELTDGQQVYYLIEDDPDSPTEFEGGYGTFNTGAPNTLTRDTVMFGSNGTSKISLASGTTYIVRGILPADALGTAAGKDIGTASGEVPTNADIATIRADGVLAPHHNLRVDADRDGLSAAQARVKADALIATGANGGQVKLTNVNKTANITNSGAGGLDTGSEASSTWYYVWAIWDGTNTAALLSTASTFAGLTLPSGYTHAALCGAVYNNGSGDFLVTGQINNHFRTEPVKVLNDVNGTTSYTSQSLANAVPPIATVARGTGFLDGQSVNITRVMFIASATNSFGEVQISGRANERSPFEVMLAENQTLYWKVDNTSDIRVNIWISGGQY